jgi:hypothetical protein
MAYTTIPVGSSGSSAISSLTPAAAAAGFVGATAAGPWGALTVTQSLSNLGVPTNTWAAQCLYDIQRDVSDVDSYYAEGINNPSTSIITSGLAGDNANGTATFPGNVSGTTNAELHTVVASTTTTASSSANLRPYGSLSLIKSPASGTHFGVSWLVKPLGSNDNQTNYSLLLYDYATLSGFRLLGGTSTTTWRLVTTRGGSAFNVAATGSGATLDFAAYHRFTMTSDGTTIRFYIDGVSAGSSNAISSLNINDSWPVVIVGNGTTAANRQMASTQWFAAWKQ